MAKTTQTEKFKTSVFVWYSDSQPGYRQEVSEVPPNIEFGAFCLYFTNNGAADYPEKAAAKWF
jgi:hypothetical protein